MKQVEIVRYEDKQEPKTGEEQAVLRVRVTGDRNKAVATLAEENFRLDVVDLSNDKAYEDMTLDDWKSPEETKPVPARIIILIDMSGSMKCPRDLDSKIVCTKEVSSPIGTRKLDAAVEALKEFLNLAKKRTGDTKIAIVPFGEAGPSCKGYEVNNTTLDNFLSIDDDKLDSQLKNLASTKPCASTNLYTPVQEAVKFLGDRSNTDFYPVDNKGKPTEPQPRLAVILVSDGFHNKGNDKAELEKLGKLLNRKDEVTIHTLGYGLKPDQLGRKFGLGRDATRADVKDYCSRIAQGCVTPEEFVDRKALTDIAQITNGIDEFAGDADEIAQKLKIFLDALLGEYEITFTPPDPERNKKYRVTVFARDKPSQPEEIQLKGFGRTLPLTVRSVLFFSTILAFLLLWFLPFYYWGQWLKRQASDN